MWIKYKQFWPCYGLVFLYLKLYLLNIDAKDRSIASLRTAEAFWVVATLRGREATTGNASAVHRLVNSELKRGFRATHVNRNWSSCILEHCFCPNFRANRFCKSNALSKTPGGGGGGVTPIHYLYGYVPPNGVVIWSSWFRKWYPFQRRFLERGIISIIFRMHESSSFVSSHLKLFKDRSLLKKIIWFNALTSKQLYSCCTLCFSMQGGRIFYFQFYGEF